MRWRRREADERIRESIAIDGAEEEEKRAKWRRRRVVVRVLGELESLVDGSQPSRVLQKS